MALDLRKNTPVKKETEVKYDIKREFETIAITETSELKLTETSWFDKESKIDLRWWNNNGKSGGSMTFEKNPELIKAIGEAFIKAASEMESDDNA